MEFPNTQDLTCNNKIYGLARRLTWQLTTFHQREPELSKQDRTRPTVPSGPETAELGLIIHIQIQESYRNIAPFCDLDEPTIRSFARKGVPNDFTLASTDTEEQRPTFANVRPTVVRLDAKGP